MLNRSGAVVIGLLLALGGCDTSGESDCEGASCGAAAGTPGASGTGTFAGSGSGGSAGSASPQGGSSPVAGSGSVAGSGVGGSSSAGTGSSGGSSSAGTSSGGSSSGGNGGSGGGAAGAANVVGQCKDDFWPAAPNGAVTRYDFKQGTPLPACTYVITHTGSGTDGDWDTVEGISTGDGGYFGAMNTEDFKQGAVCGACVEANYNGRKVVLTIVDECPIGSNPICTKGHIDLSRKAIRQLEPNGSLEDLKNVSWHYVKCPAVGNAKARLHPNQNPNWQPLVIENGLFPLQSVTLNGATAMRVGNAQGGNAWIASGQKVPYAVKATDVNGATINFTYSGDGGLKDAGTQFMCK